MDENSRIEIANHKFLSALSISHFEDLFKGFDYMQAITYSCTIDFISKLLRIVNHIEIVIGSESTLSTTHHVLFSNDTIYTKPPESIVQEAIHTNSLSVGIADVASHEKIYLLTNQEGKTRVILGSANLSGKAFEGGQRENICVLDDTDAYRYYSNVVNSLVGIKKEIKLFGKSDWLNSKAKKIEHHSYEPNYLYLYSNHYVVRKELTDLQFIYAYYGCNDWKLNIPEDVTGAFVTNGNELMQLNSNGYLAKIFHDFGKNNIYKSSETISSVFKMPDSQMLIVTQNGRISRLNISAWWTGRDKYIINLDMNDKIISAIELQSNNFEDHILVATSYGKYIMYPICQISENTIRSKGNRYMSLLPNDYVIGALLLSDDVNSIFTLTKHGRIKQVRSDVLSAYRITPQRQGAKLLSISDGDALCTICADPINPNILVICDKDRYILKNYTNNYGLIAKGDMLLDSAHLTKHPTTMITACMIPDIHE